MHEIWEMCNQILIGKPEQQGPLTELGIVFQKNIDMNVKQVQSWLDSTGSGQKPVACSCEHSNEPSDYMKGVQFINQPSDCQLLKVCLHHGVNNLHTWGVCVCVLTFTLP
jgi:hypothetical protein